MSSCRRRFGSSEEIDGEFVLGSLFEVLRPSSSDGLRMTARQPHANHTHSGQKASATKARKPKSIARNHLAKNAGEELAVPQKEQPETRTCRTRSSMFIGRRWIAGGPARKAVPTQTRGTQDLSGKPKDTTRNHPAKTAVGCAALGAMGFVAVVGLGVFGLGVLLFTPGIFDVGAGDYARAPTEIKVKEAPIN
jgi:hypothetical protein